MLRLLLPLLLVPAHLPLAAQSLTAYMLQLHGAGCDNASGILVAQAVGGSGGYTFLWDDGSTNDTLTGAGAGVHGVTVYSGTDSATASVSVHPFGIDTVIVHHVCGGSFGGPGWIDLDDIYAQYPLQFEWYDGDGTLLPENTSLLSSSVPDTFHYAMTDAEGCVDSGTVVIHGSNSVLEVFATDTALCYGESALLWYTPGFTLYDDWGLTYNSSTDTIDYINQMGSTNMYPSIGIDSLGCEVEISNDPFVYQQPHPDPIILYNHGDTLSASYMIDTTASTLYTYVWSINGVVIDTTAYSYVPITGPGLYVVSMYNQYGCSVYGTEVVTISNIAAPEAQGAVLGIAPNPAASGAPWIVELPMVPSVVPYRITDTAGRSISIGALHSGRNALGADLPAGAYLLEVADRSYRLLRKR